MIRSKIRGVRVSPVRWPLCEPFVTALGQKSHTDNVVVRVALAGGAVGYGEASSSLAMPEQTGPLMAAALVRLGRRVAGADVRDISSLIRAAWSSEGSFPTAVAAFEVALWDALAQEEGRPLHALWGTAALTEIESLVSVSAVSPERVAVRCRWAKKSGYHVIKLKLNGRDPLKLNLARLEAAHGAAPRARLLLDPNQSYTPTRLVDLDRAVTRRGFPVDAIEEPLAKRRWGLWSGVKLGRPVLLDESIHNVCDVKKALSCTAVCGVNIKMAKSGPTRGLQIIHEFKKSSKRPPLFMMGCMAESRIGLAAAVHFVAGTGCFDYADLDSDLLLKPTAQRGGYERVGRYLRLGKKARPGLGL